MKFKSLDLSMDRLIEAADSGNHQAQAELCLEYLSGNRTGIDLPKAIRYMELAAEDIYALNMCFKSARTRDETAAYFAIALQWHYGFGVPQSTKQCAENLLIAAERGHPHAQQMLAGQYRFGFGVRQDARQCEHWHLKALAAGIEDAHFDLYLLYSQEEELMDPTRAWSHLQQAAAGRDAHPNAYVFMAEAYLDGALTPSDPVEAATWFLIARSKHGQEFKELAALKSSLGAEAWAQAELRARDWLRAHEAE